MKRKCLFVLRMTVVVVIMAFGMEYSASAAIPDRYNIDMQYDAAQAVIPADIKVNARTNDAIISVGEFTDTRQVADKKIVGWVKEIDESKISVFLKNDSPTRVVANGIKDYLKKAGYKVADKIVQWDLKEGTIPTGKGSGKIIVSGNIDDMEVTCWTGVFSNDYKTNIKLTLVVADSTKRKILYKGNVSITYSKTDVSFSEGQLGHHAGIALGDAIEKVFEGKTVTQKMKEALIR